MSLPISAESHPEALDRDDAEECLDHLLSFVVERYPLGHWLGYVHEHDDSDEFHLGDARRVVQMHGMVLRPDGNEPGFFIRNRAPAIDKIFLNTRWTERGWMRALRKLEGSFTPRNPIYFGHLGSGVRRRGLWVSRSTTSRLRLSASMTGLGARRATRGIFDGHGGTVRTRERGGEGGSMEHHSPPTYLPLPLYL
jgi:hypothetical protein